MALAAAFAGCSKDESDGRLRLFAERLQNGGNKVFVDPATPNGATWNNGETINLNGSAYSIVVENDKYYLNIGSRPAGQLYALYPATMSDGNDITVSNNLDGGCAVAIHKLAINFHGSGHDVVFPMAACVAADADTLLFKHLTGGIKLTISAGSSNVDVDTIIVGALDASDNHVIRKNLTPNGLTWGGLTWTTPTLPAVPGGEVGEETGDVSAKYTDKIVLVMKNNGNTGVRINAGQSITFCVPMLADNVKTFTVKGKHGNTVVIDKNATLPEAKNIERNKMYPIPVINLLETK